MLTHTASRIGFAGVGPACHFRCCISQCCTSKFISDHDLQTCALLTVVPHRCMALLHQGARHDGRAPVACRYIPTVRGSDFLRALRRCKSSTGDRTVYRLNSSSCPSGRTVDAVLGYVR